MTQFTSKFILAVTIFSAIFFTTACGLQENEDPAAEDIKVEAQAVAKPTATGTTAPTPTTAIEPTSTKLLTEIVDPISPVSPVASGEDTMKSNNNSSVKPVPGSEKAVEFAIADLSEQTGAVADDITLMSVEPMEWPDAGLGCPQEGFMYAQVITPGYLIVLELQGKSYTYHTNQNGSSVVLCEQ